MNDLCYHTRNIRELHQLLFVICIILVQFFTYCVGLGWCMTAYEKLTKYMLYIWG